MVLASVIAGASGGALANVALSPLGGGAGLLQSYWYGAGLILGERDMYTFHWEKIKKRLEAGEDYLSVLEAEMNPAITAIANYSLQVMQKTGAIYMQGGIDFMAKLIENMLKLLAGETISDTVPGENVIPPDDVLSQQCGAGMHWDTNVQQCVPDTSPEQDFNPPPTPVPTRTPDVNNPYTSTSVFTFDNNGTPFTVTGFLPFLNIVVGIIKDMNKFFADSISGSGDPNPQALAWRTARLNDITTKYPYVVDRALIVISQGG